MIFPYIIKVFDRMAINAASNVATNIICKDLSKNFNGIVCEYELKDFMFSLEEFEKDKIVKRVSIISNTLSILIPVTWGIFIMALCIMYLIENKNEFDNDFELIYVYFSIAWPIVFLCWACMCGSHFLIECMKGKSSMKAFNRASECLC